MRVLVIEDDDSVRAAVRRALLLAGYEVIQAPTGQEGLLRAQTDIPDAHAARVGDRQVDLTRTEFQLLELLMLNPRRVLTSELIYDRVWGYDFGPPGNALHVYIGYLRRKLEAGGERRLIQTVHGVGYVLREP